MQGVQRVRDHGRLFDVMNKQRSLPFHDVAQETMLKKVKSLSGGPLDQVMDVNSLIDGFHRACHFLSLSRTTVSVVLIMNITDAQAFLRISVPIHRRVARN
jgi:hypothetical protein